MEWDQFLKKKGLPSHWKLDDRQEGLYLDTGEGHPFTVDFSKIKKLSKSQPLAKAIGFKKGHLLKVLDLTAGWGQDAFLLADLGCEVTSIEINPLVFQFLDRALSKKGLKSLSLTFLLDNSLNYLKNMEESRRPDVIYIDPMFTSEKKSLSNKPLRILQELSGDTVSNTEDLFKAARVAALRRVVVKRHRLQKSLSKSHLMGCISGRSVCYDVFLPKVGV